MKKNFLKFLRFDNPPVRFLLAANVLIIIFAVLFNWSLATILWGFWLQSVIIGFFIFLKLLVFFARADQKFSSAGLVIRLFVLLFAFGIDLLAYGAIISGICETFRKIDSVNMPSVIFIGAIFFASHAFSFWFNVIKNNEGFGKNRVSGASKRFIAKLKRIGKSALEINALSLENAKKRDESLLVGEVMLEIYLRGLPFQVFSIAVPFILMLVFIPAAILFPKYEFVDWAVLKLELVVFLAGKTIVDIISHNMQHNKSK
ncbi:MAG: DUF6498-containing protein [Candidatus ainarchaeum sp.]|nr:DUF6498-containing protein [Candidatus ainarchaeum sp.]